MVALTICAAIAAENAWTASAWDLIAPSELNAESKVHRDAVAQDLKQRLSLLIDLLSEPNPQELQRLERDELRLASGSGDARDKTALQLSVTYQHRGLVLRMRAIERSLDCVVESKQIATEMYCWAQTSLLLGDEESLRLALGTLRSAKRLPSNKDLPALVRSPEVWYTTYARGILEFIITPYLERVAATQNAP